MLNKDIYVVPMTAEHIERIAVIEELCFSQPWSIASLTEELSNGQAFFLTAFCENKLAGYIGVQEISGEGYITNVAVYPEYRRQGIASSLLKSAIEGAKRRGCVFLTLEVRAGNEAATFLYKRHGFEPVGMRKNFYINPCEDATIMTLTFGTNVNDEKNL